MIDVIANLGLLTLEHVDLVQALVALLQSEDQQ